MGDATLAGNGGDVSERSPARVKRIVAESLLVSCFGAIFAFALNAVSSRGLTLSRDYFPQDRIHSVGAVPTPSNGGSAAKTNSPSPLDLLMARLQQQGLRVADSNQVATLFGDPRRAQGMMVFVDARDDDHYQGGHIPGAYQLDYFRPFDYLAAVLPACQVAEQIVVYCNGGNCDDSLGAATLLLSASIPKEKIAVYTGGITEWSTNRMPIEVGARNSGQMRP